MASRGEHASGVDDQGCGVAPGASKIQLADSMAEWRSREQLEPSAPSTSPGYWDTDDDETSMFSSGPGPKPSDLYGKFTWKIENFSEISKRELRSNVFEVGGYKWYILVYPQGCDVCNHLSLFLCVADYDKLLPGWSHFAQFTIAVVNRDPKKSKYSDTLHRFCKKEHDWGWKKFMELSKVLDGFTVSDTLVIKAQVQVIRENPHRPFRCLDCQYRRELVRVYLTNVETICRRFVEEKREKLSKVIEDSVRWSSFRTFWSAVEDNVRRRLAREKTDVILKAVVKRFFNEKEVTSTLVMDALYSGCKALDYQNRTKKGKVEKQDPEESSTPLVWVEKDFFVLAGDILSLLEHAASESLPSYKDEKGPQNRSKDVCSGEEFGKEFVERDERRLTELGRRTIEMFVLAHLFSNRVEVAYREAVALKRQEELIREEEAAGQAESELKAKREAADKEKRSKKKQAKQRRKDRKVKDKDTSENHVHIHEAMEKITLSRVSKQHLMLDSEASSVLLTETGDEEGELSGLDNIEDAGALGATTEDADIDSSRWGSIGQAEEASFSGSLSEDVRGVVQTGKKNLSTLDDSSSTCSSDSVPAHIGNANGCFGTHPSPLEHSHSHSHSRTRGRNRSEGYDNDGHLMETEGLLRTSVSDACSAGEPSSSSSLPSAEAETMISSLRERVQCLEKTVAEKFIPPAGLKTSHPPYSYKWGNSWRDREISSLREQVNLLQCKAGAARQSGATSMNSTRQLVSTEPATMPAYSRPSTAPILANGPRPSSAHPPLHPVPSLARTMSAAGRLNAVVETITEGLDASSRQTPSMALSYRNAAIGKAASPGYNPDRLPTSSRPVSGMTVSSPHGQPRPGSPGMPSKNLGMSSLPTTPKHVPPYEQPRSSSGGFVMSEPAGLMANMHPDNDGMTPDKLTQHRCDGNKESVAITFGTVTQDVLHNEQQTQHEDCSQETGKTAHLQEQDQYDQRQFSKAVEQNQSQQHLLHSQRLQPGLSENGSSSITRQAAEFASLDNTNNGSSLSEGFPHLDIINDLLDDDKYVGRILTTAVHENLHGQRSLPSLNGMLHVMEDREHKLLEACSQIQAMSSASYGLLPSSLQTDHSRLHDRYWALSRPSTPVIASSSPMLRNALDIHNRYPFIHSPQIVLSDNSGVSPGNDGYASFTSLQ